MNPDEFILIPPPFVHLFVILFMLKINQLLN